jgi:hypothetical protein
MPIDSNYLKAPFPYFGGKRRAAEMIWQALGPVDHYIEPFCGSAAVLLGRPGGPGKVETINDFDGMIANFWRCMAYKTEELARYADWPVSEVDIHARHLWLIAQRAKLTENLIADPHYCDAKIAGWWCWGLCGWIGSGWCTASALNSNPQDASVVLTGDDQEDETLAPGTEIQTGWSEGGAKVTRKLPPMGEEKVSRKLPQIGGGGRGVHSGTANRQPSKQLPHIGGTGMGVHSRRADGGSSESEPEIGTSSIGGILYWFRQLQARLQDVRVCCGDWERLVASPSTLFPVGGGKCMTGIFLDPPYAEGEQQYAVGGTGTNLSAEVRAWVIENGENPNLRIVLSGYEGEHPMPSNWSVIEWKASGGYANTGTSGNPNRFRERIWCSPHCVPSGGALTDLQALF